MDCFFHPNVPSVAPCADCQKSICFTCRDERGACPSCRLAAKIGAATATKTRISGQVPFQPHAPPPAARATVTTAGDSVESRVLVALGYPLWPLALLALFDRKQSRYLRRQAYQAVGLNLGFAASWGILTLLSNVPWLGSPAIILNTLLLPLFLVASVYYGIKVWHGDEVHVPIVGDWVDERIPA